MSCEAMAVSRTAVRSDHDEAEVNLSSPSLLWIPTTSRFPTCEAAFRLHRGTKFLQSQLLNSEHDGNRNELT